MKHFFRKTVNRVHAVVTHEGNGLFLGFAPGYDTSFQQAFALRVDGTLYDKMKPPVRLQPAVVSRIKIMSGMDISDRRVPQDGGMSVMVRGRGVDLRVSTMPGKFGEKVVMRVIDKQAGLLDLSSLGFSESMLERLREVIHQPNGVVLVTGPTGSGKSTTLYGCLQELVSGTASNSPTPSSSRLCFRNRSRR